MRKRAAAAAAAVFALAAAVSASVSAASLARAQDTGASLCDAAGVQQFSDVAVDGFAAEYILCARALALSQGKSDGTFGPSDDLTRAQMAAFLIRLWRDVLGRSCPTDAGHSFTDVPTGYFAAADIACLHGLGIAKGRTTTSYAPAADVTTAQLTRFITRLYNKASPDACDIAADELKAAAVCLTAADIAPSAYEAKTPIPATRSQMAVYLIGTWHHITGRGHPPKPPVTTRIPKAVAITPGYAHACALLSDKTVTCWGDNDHGQADPPDGTFTQITTSSEHSCGVRTDKTVTCWGTGSHGQTTPPSGAFTQVATGVYDSCGVRADKTVACWGNEYTGIADPVDGEFTQIAAGSYHYCGVRPDKTIACWGDDIFEETTPPSGAFTQITAGDLYSCGVRSDKTAACWGYNGDGQTAPPDGEFTRITAGSEHVCGLRADRALVCWGDNYYGQTDIPIGAFKDVSAGGEQTCGITAKSRVQCWGKVTGAPPVILSGVPVALHSSAALLVEGDFTVDATFDSPVSGLTASGFQAVNGEVTSLVGHGNRYSATIKPAESGSVLVRVRPDAAAGADGSNVASAPLFRVRVDDTARHRPGVNTADRDAVVRAARSEFLREEPDTGFSGDVGRCDAGANSPAFRDSVFRRVNWYRRMAGVPDVAENAAYSATAQKAALIMSARGDLSHYPPEDWECYSEEGYEGASSSNLSLGSYGVSAIDGQMQDSGGHNFRVGHRRWILHPWTREMGTGDIPGTDDGRPANSLRVIGSHRGASAGIREERGFIAWPPPGYTPARAAWGRWSFSLPGADFSAAEVAMTALGSAGATPVEVLAKEGFGYGEATIVWAAAGDENSEQMPAPSAPDRDRCYAVGISGVKVGGNTQPPYQYAVCILDIAGN